VIKIKKASNTVWPWLGDNTTRAYITTQFYAGGSCAFKLLAIMLHMTIKLYYYETRSSPSMLVIYCTMSISALHATLSFFFLKIICYYFTKNIHSIMQTINNSQTIFKCVKQCGIPYGEWHVELKRPLNLVRP